MHYQNQCSPALIVALYKNQPPAERTKFCCHNMYYKNQSSPASSSTIKESTANRTNLKFCCHNRHYMNQSSPVQIRQIVQIRTTTSPKLIVQIKHLPQTVTLEDKHRVMNGARSLYRNVLYCVAGYFP